MSTVEMATTAKTYREIQAEIRLLEAQADALKQQMIREMDERQVDQLLAGEYIIRYSLYESNRLDTTALKKALPDVAAQFMKSTVSAKFLIS